MHGILVRAHAVHIVRPLRVHVEQITSALCNGQAGLYLASNSLSMIEHLDFFTLYARVDPASLYHSDEHSDT